VELVTISNPGPDTQRVFEVAKLLTARHQNVADTLEILIIESGLGKHCELVLELSRSHNQRFWEDLEKQRLESTVRTQEGRIKELEQLIPQPSASTQKPAA
jgi:hypothetical protein